MKNCFLAVTMMVATLFFSTGDALAARKITTVEGVLGAVTKGKGILKTTGASNFYFDTTSEAGKKILSVCQTGKPCVVRGVINGSTILNAYYIKIGN